MRGTRHARAAPPAGRVTLAQTGLSCGSCRRSRRIPSELFRFLTRGSTQRRIALRHQRLDGLHFARCLPWPRRAPKPRQRLRPLATPPAPAARPLPRPGINLLGAVSASSPGRPWLIESPCESPGNAFHYARECNPGQPSPARPALTSDLRKAVTSRVNDTGPPPAGHGAPSIRTRNCRQGNGGRNSRIFRFFFL